MRSRCTFIQVGKSRLSSGFRRCFPRVSFSVTTHDPLCLKGLHDGEIVVLRRDEVDRIVAVTGLPSVEDLRVDQILTSEMFGLRATRGAWGRHSNSAAGGGAVEKCGTSIGPLGQ